MAGMSSVGTRRAREESEDGRRPGGSGATPLSYIGLIALALFAGLPLLALLFNAVKTPLEIGTNPLGFPQDIQLSNFVEAWKRGNMAQGLVNSTILVVGTILGTLVTAGPAAYALARLDLPFKRGIEAYLFLLIALPVQMFLVPLFFLWTRIGLIDTLIGLIIIYVALNTPFSVLLLRTYLVRIPRELDEAARIDGAGEWQVATRVILPVAMPGLLTVGLLSGLGAYSELLFCVTFLTNPAGMPVSTSFLNFSQGYSQQYGLVNAAGVIVLIPVLLLFLLMQRRFISGLATGSVKS